MRDLNDRHSWYDDGRKDEVLFCMLFGHTFGLKINPAKEDDPCVPDLIHRSGEICELKTRRTPFFTAFNSYMVYPQYAVTINRNDMVRYWQDHRNMPIYFWVQWTQLKWQNIEVKPMHGLWGIRVEHLAALCTDENLHAYQGRVDDDRGNAKDSYVIDLNDMKELWKVM